MKQNSACTYCGNEYPYRKGKIYCSQSCKTMAHRNRQLTVDDVTNSVRSERKTFYLSDYVAWSDNNYFSFVMYCFFIKGQPENETPEILGELASAISNDEKLISKIEDGASPINKEYKKFVEQFFSDKYIIKKSRLEAETLKSLSNI